MSSPATSIPGKQAAEHPASTVGSSGKRASRLVYWLTALLVCSLLAVVYFQFTGVSGIELNNQTWQMRQFSFRRDPLTNTQLTGIVHTAPPDLPPWKSAVKLATLNNAITSHLRSNLSTQAKWDLVRDESNTHRGGAAILVELLSAVDDKYRPYWTQWSNSHPRKAGLFWPAVQDLARVGLYAPMPELFEAALSDLSEAEFQQQIADCLQSATLERASLLMAESQNQEARSIAEVGLLYGEDPRLTQIVQQLNASEAPR